MGLGHLVPASNASLTAQNLAAAPGVYAEFIVTKPCNIQQLNFCVTTLVAASVTAPQVKVKQRITPGSDTGAVDLCTLTIPNGTAVGKVLYKKIGSVQLNMGDSLVFQLVTQAADATSAAGAGFYDVVLALDEESEGNQGDAVASA